jgi:hypothetical protein
VLDRSPIWSKALSSLSESALFIWQPTVQT